MQVRLIIGTFLQLVGGGCCVFSLIIFFYNLGIAIISAPSVRDTHAEFTNIAQIIFYIVWPLGFTGIFWGIWSTGKFLSGSLRPTPYNKLVEAYDKLRYKQAKPKQDRNLPDK
ncbi:MAG: hypothetical protein PSY14_00245 [bacterium]|nr:hypothetical protein [bacterium]